MVPGWKQKGSKVDGLGTFPQFSIFVRKSFKECCSESNNQRAYHLSTCTPANTLSTSCLEDSNCPSHWSPGVRVFKFLGIFYMMTELSRSHFVQQVLTSALFSGFSLCLSDCPLLSESNGNFFKFTFTFSFALPTYFCSRFPWGIFHCHLSC